MAVLNRNGWQVQAGMPGSFIPEWVAGSRRIFHYTVLSDLDPYVIAVVKDAINSEELDNTLSLTIVETVSIQQALKLLIFGRVDIFSGPEENVLYLIKTKYPEYVEKIERIGEPLTSQDIYCAFSKGIPDGLDLLKAFNDGLSEIRRNGVYEELKNKHGISELQ